jgi:DNA-binding response OmpR family regulator
MARVTIIDDDVELAGDLAALLREQGFTVSTRDDTRGAIEELIRDTPDLLILDVMFPENPAAGFDLARKVRQTPQTSGLPIILLTAVNQEFPMDFSLKDVDPTWMPVQDFVEKPVEPMVLLEKVAAILRGQPRS